MWPSTLVIVDCVNADPDRVHPAGQQQLQTGACVVSKCHKGESKPKSSPFDLWTCKSFFLSHTSLNSYEGPNKTKLQPTKMLSPYQFLENKLQKYFCACARSVTYPPGSRAPGSTAGPLKSRTCCCGWPERSATSSRHQGATSPSPSAHSEGSQRNLWRPKWLTVALSAASSQQGACARSLCPAGCQDARCGPTDLRHSCFSFCQCYVTANITHRTLHLACPKKIYRLMGQPNRVCIVLCCSCLPLVVSPCYWSPYYWGSFRKQQYCTKTLNWRAEILFIIFFFF